MNGSELRFGCIENWLNLCLLIRGQAQLLGDSPKAKRVPVAATGPVRAGLRLHNNKAAKRYRARGHKR